MKHSFKSFLSENYQQQVTGDEIGELAKILVRECSNYIKENNPMKMLYRGTRLNGLLTKKQMYTARESVDMPQALNTAIDDKANLDFNPRTGATFAINNPTTARYYGPVGYFFPIGDYRYAYMDGVSDLLGYMDHIPPEVKERLDKKARSLGLKDFGSNHLFKKYPDEFADEINEIASILAAKYRCDDLHHGIKSGAEISFYSPDGYYLVNSDMIPRDELIYAINLEMKKQ